LLRLLFIQLNAQLECTVQMWKLQSLVCEWCNTLVSMVTMQRTERRSGFERGHDIQMFSPSHDGATDSSSNL
jgi:hypothetical protein